MLDLVADNKGFSHKEYVEYLYSKFHMGKDVEDSTKKGFLSVGNNYGLSEDEQRDYQEEARSILLPLLHEELGLDISKAVCKYSLVNRVTKDGSPVPIVIKSYMNHDHSLRINPSEWTQLMKKNAILAVRYGRNQYGYYSIYDLLKAKDEIVLSFRSDNIDKEDRIDKFAELLQYFNYVHFNFNDIGKPKQFNINDPFSCSFNKTNNASEADLSADDIRDIE